MLIWDSKIKNLKLPLYQSIAETIRNGIQSGDLKPGERLPPHRELANQIGVTVGTVARGYNLAASWGLVYGEVGKGTIVASPESNYTHVPLNLKDSFFDLGIIKPTSTTDASLRKLAYEDTLKKIGLRWKNKAFVGFPPEFGLSQYRDAGVSWLTQLGIEASREEVLVTAGAQEAIHLLLTNLTDPGDPILVEELTHISFKELAGILNLKMIGIPMDDQGILPDSLRAASDQSKARVLFLTPTYNSPTTAIMGRQRREQLIDLAIKKNLFIIENGVFSNFVANPPSPIAALCPEQTAYVASLSFCAAPEIRIGYLKTMKKNIPKLKATKRALAVSGSMISAEIATHWINSGILDQLIEWQAREISARAELADGILKGLDYCYSAGGLFIWLYLPEPWRVTDFTKAANDRNTIAMESERFVIGRGAAPHAIRISLTSTQSRELLVEGLKIIVDLINSPSKFNPLD